MDTDSEASDISNNDELEKEDTTRTLLNATEVTFHRNDHGSSSLLFHINRNEANILVGKEAAIMRNNNINSENSAQLDASATFAIRSPSLDVVTLPQTDAFARDSSIDEYLSYKIKFVLLHQLKCNVLKKLRNFGDQDSRKQLSGHIDALYCNEDKLHFKNFQFVGTKVEQ